ncbi:TfoX N-terminal domain-containing protein [Rhizobiales bacterium GAS191]|jgi:TfoX/Sxy family transcriptional regulator of competence genes|nr:TfoX N-terminal domain-containing protein [Rhizobiales bacterium GAS113]SEB95759.1 TfoX N-terminal domain-containing protein [Rhizobiales bacterium GAS191]SED22187.1 TfoX N-terminal domain-containing protein [Rhizobiales bacterium GAS188]
MAHDARAAERVRRILSIQKNVVERKMIGGLSFMVDGHMCCGVTGTALMVRVGAEALERALAEPHVRPMAFAGKQLAGFICVDPEGYRSDAALAGWVKQGIDFVSTLEAKKPVRAR